MADRKGWTPLMFACQDGHAKCVRALVAVRAQLDIGEEDGWTALMIACQEGHEPCAKLLVDAGASVAAKAASGLTASQIARRLLEARGEDPDEFG